MDHDVNMNYALENKVIINPIEDELYEVFSQLGSFVKSICVKRQSYFPVPAPSLFSSSAINRLPVSS